MAMRINVVVGTGSELLRRSEPVLRSAFGRGYEYARAVVEHGTGSIALATIDGIDAGAAVFYRVRVGEATLCVVYYIAVIEEYRNRGLGKAMMRAIEENCRGVDAYVATTWYGNDAADALYRSLGYIPYSWDYIEGTFGRRVLDKLLKATCGYDDDLIYIKLRSGINIEDLVGKVVKGGDNVSSLWRSTCLGTWLKLRASWK